MVKQDRGCRLLTAAGLLALSLLIWLALMQQFRLDDSFITYRYARNAARGWGLVYNQDEMVLSTTAPLYALLLAALSPVIPDFHLLGGVIGALCIGAGGALLAQLAPPTIPAWIRAWGGLLYVLSAPLWLALGMETPVWLLMALCAVWLARHERWRQAGLLVGLAIPVRPDAAIPTLLLGAAASGAAVNALGVRRRWWQPLADYGLAAAVPAALFAIWVWATYGSPLPATLPAKSAQAVLGITGFGVFTDAWNGLLLIIESLLKQSPAYLVFAPLLLAGLSRKTPWPVALVVVWGIIHLLAYVVLGVAPYRWYYVPLLPGLLLLAACGLNRIRLALDGAQAGRYAVGAIAALPIAACLTSFALIAAYFQRGGPRDTMLPIVDWQAYREAGEWLNANTPPNAVVGVAEVGQVGFYADRYMTDYLGLLQPDAAAMLKRGDLYSWLVGYAPDYLVFQRFGGKVGLALYNYFIEYDPWFVASYREVAKFDDPRYILGPVVIYQRVFPADRDLQAQPVDADFGPLRLVGLAADLQGNPAGPARVRLDWQVTGALPNDLHIGIAALDMPHEVKYDGDYRTQNWPPTLTTWHTLMLPEDVSPGRYPLWVSIGPINGEFVPRTVGYLDVGSVHSFGPQGLPAVNAAL